jgi:ribonuclease M5
MLKIKQTIIVEGKHDKIKLKSIVDANIITTDGFRIYNNKQKRALIKKIAETTGIIILTDSDDAGRRIRNFIKSCTGGGGADAVIINAYAPESGAGIEGTDKDVLIGVLERFGIGNPPALTGTPLWQGGQEETQEKISSPPLLKGGSDGVAGGIRKIAKLDFYADGLSGGEGSRKKREYLCQRLGIPCMPSNALLECVNILINYEEYKKIVNDYVII